MSEIKFIGNQNDLANWLNTIDGLLKMDLATDCQKKTIDGLLSRVRLDVIKNMTIPEAVEWVDNNVKLTIFTRTDLNVSASVKGLTIEKFC